MPSNRQPQPPEDDDLERLYRRMLAETMRPCPEYHAADPVSDPSEQAAADARREGLATFFGDDPVDHTPRQRPLRAA